MMLLTTFITPRCSYYIRSMATRIRTSKPYIYPRSLSRMHSFTHLGRLFCLPVNDRFTTHMTCSQALPYAPREGCGARLSTPQIPLPKTRAWISVRLILQDRSSLSPGGEVTYTLWIGRAAGDRLSGASRRTRRSRRSGGRADRGEGRGS